MLDRLGAEFSAALDKIDASGKGPRMLARVLDADVVLCHRLLAGIRHKGPAADRVAAWPGEAGLRALAQRCSAVAGVPFAPLARAVDEYARFIELAGGSHARLVRHTRSLQGSGTSSDDSPNTARTARRSLVRAAGDLLGYDAELITHISITRPIPTQPELIEGCSTFGMIGLSAHGGRICVTSSNVQLRQTADAVAGEVRWTPLGKPVDGRDGLLTDFCSAPNLLTASEGNDGYIRQMVDLDVLRDQGKADIVLARSWRPDTNPQYTPDPKWSNILRMRHPAKRMLFDVYMHRSMLSGSPPEVGAYVWHPSLRDDPRSQWQDRFPVTCPVQVLPSSSPAVSESWTRQAELTEHLFELMGWHRSEYVGFRCEDVSPVWSAAYYMTFDVRRALPESREPRSK